MKEEDEVIFYDCQKANEDKDWSGKDPKHYPVGTIVKIYQYPNIYREWVADIQRVDGTISNAHFLSGLKHKN